MHRVCKIFSFSAAHILETSFSTACQKTHGHNYKVEVVLSSTVLNRDGMVIDFGKLKETAAPIIDHLDHKMLVKGHGHGEKNGILYMDMNPTAENIAKHIHTTFARACEMDKILLSQREKDSAGRIRKVYIERIRVWETDTCWAEYTE